MIDVRVVSIGAMAANPLWNERTPVRTGHATTTLIRGDDRTILVDPGLPAPALAARLEERSGLRPDAITHVFLTAFKPETTRALPLFEKAEWLVFEREREGVGVPLVHELQRAREAGDEELVQSLGKDVALLQRCQAAPDSLAEQVDLFPLPGATPGTCGLIVARPQATLVVCGDAIPTVEHLEQGKVPPSCADVEQAKESLMEAVEIADLLILGRDNLAPSPVRQGAS